MGISTLGATTSDNWVQIAATNPAATTLNFTSISNYRKLMVLVTAGTGTLTTIRFNSDSGTKYAYIGMGNSSGTPVETASYTTSAVSAGYDKQLRLEIDSADTSNTKKYTCWQDTTGGAQLELTGIYQATAAITSINLAWSATFSQTVYLYGVSA